LQRPKIHFTQYFICHWNVKIEFIFLLIIFTLYFCLIITFFTIIYFNHLLHNSKIYFWSQNLCLQPNPNPQHNSPPSNLNSILHDVKLEEGDGAMSSFTPLWGCTILSVTGGTQNPNFGCISRCCHL
jgi:hypothetical protein